MWNLQIVAKTKEGKVVKFTGVGLIALPMAFPGKYVIEMTTEAKTLSQAATINPDRRFSLSSEKHEAMFDAQVEVIAIFK